MNKCKRYINYAATYTNAHIRFHASDMILTLHTDAAYLVITKAQSRIAGYYYPGNRPNAKYHPKLNGSVIIECKTLNHVVASATESETGEIFTNPQMAIPIRVILEVMNHPQPTTPIKSDNATSVGFFNKDTNKRNQNLGICSIIVSETDKINAN